MGGVTDHLPAPFADEEILSLLDAISLPRPILIKSLKVTAAFHTIYTLTYPPGVFLEAYHGTAIKSTTEPLELVLRIAGDHVPRIKTENEAAILQWLRRNTSIPVPEVIAYDASLENPLRREFIILNRCPGLPISDIYDSLTPKQLESILQQLTQILKELHSHTFSSIGGSTHVPGDPETVVPGPILDEWFWFEPDIENHFPPSESYTTINILGPFQSYTSYIAALVEKYIRTARIHRSLDFLRPLLPRLSAFISKLHEHAAALDNVSIRLAHKDLHFANILYDPTTESISAVLDWEFSGTVPFPLWDPPRAFLWNGRDGDDAYDEKNRLREGFAQMCRDEGAEYLVNDAEFMSELQEKAYKVANMMRWFTSFVPKGQFLDRVDGWMADLAKELEAFGV
ncbi:hypothetical protein MGG_10936 [Paecilomyces variotii No. 5]|uniref:Aminoglycoside phosphotransferase domain-containing protein n=1 Tax=Byssochlamys spectabilis (strain No. 5 / NBRC 109023) TaxID=1356009 RepID=V5FKG4_BYSSN|nr:hypothetical protein MGG_10936 [Paecilomyces variotii No. 5]